MDLEIRVSPGSPYDDPPDHFALLQALGDKVHVGGLDLHRNAVATIFYRRKRCSTSPCERVQDNVAHEAKHSDQPSGNFKGIRSRMAVSQLARNIGPYRGKPFHIL